jgi:hypothetical protein
VRIVALFVHRIFPGSAATGRLVWVLPTVILAIAFVTQIVTASLGGAISTFVFPGPNGEGWWAVVLMTYPTTTAILYSVGMCFATRKAQSIRSHTLPED